MIAGVSASTISRVVKTKKETGSDTPKRKYGHKRKTTPRDDAYLLQESVKDPKKNKLRHKNYSGKKGIEISSSRVLRHPLEVGRWIWCVSTR